MQGSLEAQFVELTILQVQTSCPCGSSIYAKAGKQAATVELPILQVRTSGTEALAFMLKQESRLLPWNSHYWKFNLHGTGSCFYAKAGKQAVTVEFTLL
jgi:hypothetical protein